MIIIIKKKEEKDEIKERPIKAEKADVIKAKLLEERLIKAKLLEERLIKAKAEKVEQENK